MYTTTITDIITKAGSIGYILAGLSIIGLTIALVKIAQMVSLRIVNMKFVDRAVDALAVGDIESAATLLQQHRHPTARVMTKTVTSANDSVISDATLHAEIDLAMEAECQLLQAGCRPLTAIAQLSPLIGLLGTVTGMIIAFSQLEMAQRQVDPSLLAGGIWQALLTTAMGLAIAIPLRAVLYYLEGEMEHITNRMQAAVIQTLVVCGRDPIAAPLTAPESV